MTEIRITNKKDIDKLHKNELLASGSVVALGFFDGVHTAHRALIKAAKAEADRLSLPLVIFTFSANDKSLKPDAARLYSDGEKMEILRSLGADATVNTSFSAVSDMEASDFVTDLLVGALGCRVAVLGFNFRFGKGALGTAEDMKAYMQRSGGSATVLEEYTYSGKALSSSRIREIIGKGDVREAAMLLGVPYFISGKVSHGLGLGRSLGIPTVNLPLKEGSPLIPGVYSTVVSIGEKRFLGLTNVGICPTFGEREVHTETFILDFEGDVYGEDVRVYFIDRLRDEKQFKSADELIMQINVDKIKALELLGDLRWQEIGLN